MFLLMCFGLVGFSSYEHTHEDAELRQRLTSACKRSDGRYAKPYQLSWKELRTFKRQNGEITESLKQEGECVSSGNKCLLRMHNMTTHRIGLAGWNERYIWGLGQVPGEDKWSLSALTSDWESDIAKSARRLKYSMVMRPDCVFPNLNAPDDLDLDAWVNLKSFRVVSSKSENGYLVVRFACSLPQHRSKDFAVTGEVALEIGNNFAPVRVDYSSEVGTKMNAVLSYAATAQEDGYRPCTGCKRVLHIPDGNAMIGEYQYEFKGIERTDDKQFYISTYGFHEPDEPVGTSNDDAKLEARAGFYYWLLLTLFAVLLMAAFYLRKLSIRSRRLEGT